MRAGGNQAVQEFFAKHGVSALSKDALNKYTSKAAQQYKKQLVQRAKTMQARYLWITTGSMLDSLTDIW